MPLNIEPRSGEDFVPYIKFDAKAGRWFTKNDGDNTVVEVENKVAIFDLQNIKLGWLLFTENSAPEAVWDNGKIEPQPSPKHKRGVCFNIFSPQNIGGLKEFRANSNSVIEAVKNLYDQQYEPAPERLQGLVPVVKFDGVLPRKGKFGTNYLPVLQIVKWVPRPQAMPGAALNAPAAVQQEPVPPPVQARTQAQPQQMAEEF